MDAAAAPDARRCPLCGAANRCAMERERETGVKQPPCWCTAPGFNRDALERIPAQARGQACICPACGAPAA